MRKDSWIIYHKRPVLNKPIALIGSPGLRSIGKLVVDYLINKLKPRLMAELYSIHFPIIYQTKPSYVAQPRLPGVGGIRITSGEVDLPKIQFYYCTSQPLIITRGCHANFNGQYEVADKVLDLYNEVGVSMMIVVAGQGLVEKKICCAATSYESVEELKKKYGIEKGYSGPFYGFSGIVFGLAKLRQIDAICLFAKTEPTLENPECPDEEASKNLLKELSRILNFEIDVR